MSPEVCPGAAASSPGRQSFKHADSYRIVGRCVEGVVEARLLDEADHRYAGADRPRLYRSDVVLADTLWVVGGSTLALAIFTAILALATWRLARQTSDEVKIERRRAEAAERPLVYPLALDDWKLQTGAYEREAKQLLPLKNGGSGLALGVHGACWLPNPSGPRQSLEIEGGTIAAHETFDARLERSLPQGWAGVEGFIGYRDLAGEEWVTHFRCGHGRTNQLICQHDPPGRVAELGDPRQRYRSTM
jgi:hypothetical protein